MLLHQSSNLLLVPSKFPGSGTNPLCPPGVGAAGSAALIMLAVSSGIVGSSDSSSVSSDEVSSEVVSSSITPDGSLYDCADTPERVRLMGSAPVVVPSNMRFMLMHSLLLGELMTLHQMLQPLYE